MPQRFTDLDGRIGEALSGDGVNATHINLVIGVRGSATAAAISTTLALTAPGHVPMLACLGAGYAVRPMTVIRNKTTLDGPDTERFAWGAVQLGIADGVMHAVQEGIIDPAQVDDLVFLVAVYTDPGADDEPAVRAANAQAMYDAIDDATSPSDVGPLIERRSTATNPFYAG
jgi:5,6,7,8-tetrahydromethanopterin hydro-lyase